MNIWVLIGAALAGLAFWRRKSLKADAGRVTTAAKGATSSATARLSRSGGEAAEAVEEAVSDAADTVEDAVAEAKDAVDEAPAAAAE